MMTSVAGLRREIRELAEKRARGDIPERTFGKQNEKLTLELCRLLVGSRLAKGESIQSEHHVIRAHMKLTGSVLRESDQESISLVATDRRLFRLSCTHDAKGPVLYANGGRDKVEEIPLARIRRVVVRRQVRTGEIFTGLAIAAFALLLRPWLAVTGSALVLLGVLGALHGLLVPTRWAEVLTAESDCDFRIYALRKRSAKRLIRAVVSCGRS